MTWIAVAGAGGFGRETHHIITIHPDLRMLAFVERAGSMIGTTINGAAVQKIEYYLKHDDLPEMVVAIGNPRTRGDVVWRYNMHEVLWGNVIHPSVYVSPTNDIGVGNIICGNTQMTTNISIGNHNQINMACTIGHDVVIGDFVTLGPGAHISGNVHIGNYVWIGSGATVIDGSSSKPLMIADGAVIAAGATVIGDALPDRLYAGVPAVEKKSYA